MTKGKYKFGDICLVKFHPAYGSEFKKYRPALIINSSLTTIDPRFVLICPLTTKTEKKNDFEYLIKKSKFLEKDSLALLWYMRTVDITRLEKKLGSLPKSEIVKVGAVLQKFFK